MKIKFLTVLSLAVVLFLGACGGKSDTELQSAASDKLKADTDTSNVTVVVSEGVATISGEVKDQAAKAKAETLAKVEGVKSVTNNVEVAPTTPTQSATSSSVDKDKIEKALKDKGFEDVTVDTSTTPATLRGSVAKGKMAEAIQTAQEAAGKPMKNEITEK